ncbi:MAG: methyl-accepting chemotaxis protein [Saccharospirillum sp.]
MRKNLPVTDQAVTFGDDEKLISATDLKGHILHCNEAFVRVSGYTRDELIGQPHNLIRHPDMPQLAFQVMWEHLKAGRPWMGLVKNRCKNGDYYWVDAYVTPVTDGGKVVGYESVRSVPRAEDVQRAEKLYRHYARFNGRKQSEQPTLTKPWWQRPAEQWLLLMAVLLVAITFFTAGLEAAWLELTVVFAAIAVYSSFRLWYFYRSLDDMVAHCFTHPLAERTYTASRGKKAMLEVAIKSEKSHLGAVLTRIEDAANSLIGKAQAVGDISSGSRENLSNQQQETELVATAMNEMTATVSDVSANVSRTAKNADESRKLAIAGESLAAETLNSIAQLQTAVTDIASAVTALSEQSDRIIDAAQIIDQIAEQTNLLALNAAIEAARAGEHGRGFAVVADEVRNLARRTQDSTQDIHSIITTLSQRSSEAVNAATTGSREAETGVAKVHELERSLKDIAEAMHNIAEMTDQMAAAVEEQAHVAEDVNQQVNTIASLANESLDSGKQTSSNVDELIEIAHGLQEVVVRFKR